MKPPGAIWLTEFFRAVSRVKSYKVVRAVRGGTEYLLLLSVLIWPWPEGGALNLASEFKVRSTVVPVMLKFVELLETLLEWISRHFGDEGAWVVIW